MATGVGESGPQSIVGQLVEDDSTVSFVEMCGRCGVPAEVIMTLVEEGVIEPQEQTVLQWTFTVTSVRRASAAIRLQRDLSVNLPGVALALELLDRIEALEAQLGRAAG